MNELIPSPDVLPAAPALFRALQVLVFPVHLLFMNALLGTAGIALYAGWRKGEVHRELAHELARILPVLVAMTVNFGIAALLFVQILYGTFLYTSSILMGIFWISVIPLVILVYYAVYLYDFRFRKLGGMRQAIIALALLMLVGIPFLFTNNMTLMLRPELWEGWFSHPAGTLLNLSDVTLYPRYLHFLFGGLAIGGMFVALFGVYRRRRSPETGALAGKLGMNLFLYMTFLQVADGLVFFMLLEPEVRARFLGGHAHGTGVFVGAMVLILFAFAAALRKRPALTAWLAIPLVVLMTEIRHGVRTGHLDPYQSLGQLPVDPQLSPLILFLVTLVAGLGVIFWMVREFLRSGSDSPERKEIYSPEETRNTPYSAGGSVP